MSGADHSHNMKLPLQTSAARASAVAIAKALEDFYGDPSFTNKRAAVNALQAHLAQIEISRVQAA